LSLLQVNKSFVLNFRSEKLILYIQYEAASKTLVDKQNNKRLLHDWNRPQII